MKFAAPRLPAEKDPQFLGVFSKVVEQKGLCSASTQPDMMLWELQNPFQPTTSPRR
jgi:hypothetical protein